MIEGPIFQPERIAAKLAMVGDRRNAELSAQFEKQPRLTPETAAEYADYLRPGPNRKKLYVLPSGDVTPQPTAPSSGTQAFQRAKSATASFSYSSLAIRWLAR